MRSVHKRRHSPTEKCRLTFPTYHTVSGFPLCTCAVAWHLKSVVKLTWTVMGFHFISPKDRKRYLPLLPATLMFRLRVWSSAPQRSSTLTWNLGSVSVQRTHNVSQNMRYGLWSMWERQLQLCHSYFKLLLMKENSTPGPNASAEHLFKHSSLLNAAAAWGSVTFFISPCRAFQNESDKFCVRVIQDGMFVYLYAFFWSKPAFASN